MRELPDSEDPNSTDLAPLLSTGMNSVIESDQFKTDCHTCVDEVDLDKNGELSTEELWPILVSLENEHSIRTKMRIIYRE